MEIDPTKKSKYASVGVGEAGLQASLSYNINHKKRK